MEIKFKVIKNKARKYKESDRLPLYVRLVDGRAFDQTAKTSIMVSPILWHADREEIKARSICSQEEAEERAKINKTVSDMREFLLRSYSSAKLEGGLVKGWLAAEIANYYEIPDKLAFEDVFDKFLKEHPLSDARIKQYEVVKRSLLRYEMYVRITSDSTYRIDLSTIASEDLDDIWEYILHECELFKKHPELLEAFPNKKMPQPRGLNTMADIFKKIRAFFRWGHQNGFLEKNPFEGFKIAQELYGTPIYLTKEEVKLLYQTDFSKHPDLEIQRDIFVFHCNIGCRVGDLMRMRKRDVQNGILSYIPHKTLNDNARTVSVPLNEVAMAIYNKYISDDLAAPIFPFIYPQDYNDAIKLCLRMAGITRMVVVLDPLTRTEVKKPICEVASSHMARRTLVGNLYKQVKDPNLVGSLTGHVEGSRAFSRYRDIDNDIKKELVDMLN